MTEGNGTAPERIVTDDLDALIETLPPRLAEKLESADHRSELLEVVMDLGRLPEARYPNREIVLSHREVTEEDIDFVTARVGEFGDDNRAGIERTLHRISAIRNRRGKVVGLTCRIGRAVYGTIRIIENLVMSGDSILLLGRPGVGKTTMLREVARVLADEANKRVVIVDTSNEIGGDGDIPHPAIGGARRMQVSTPARQHGVMIEAVENHMPEVIVIDEIGTELEAGAARTIAERGVQLVGTAHGNTLENLMANPTLCDLIGGIQSVTLSDEEARRRGTQKSILERMAPPTFDAVIEIQGWRRVALHEDVGATVDAKLRGFAAPPEVRELTDEGTIAAVAPDEPEVPAPVERVRSQEGNGAGAREQETRLFPFGLSRGRLVQAIQETGVPVQVVDDLRHGRRADHAAALLPEEAGACARGGGAVAADLRDQEQHALPDGAGAAPVPRRARPSRSGGASVPRDGGGDRAGAERRARAGAGAGEQLHPARPARARGALQPR